MQLHTFCFCFFFHRLNTLGVTGGKDLVSYEAARVQQNYSSDDEMDAKDMIGTLEVNNLEDILIYGADTMGSQRARYFQLKQGLIQSEYESSRQLAPHRKKVIAVLMEFIDHKEIVLLIVNVFDNMFQRYWYVFFRLAYLFENIKLSFCFFSLYL